MKEHPILFSGPMVRALLNTKRNIWPPEPADSSKPCKGVTRRLSEQWIKVKAGDHLWVRETHAIISTDTGTVSVARAERMPAGKTLAETDGGLDVIRIEDPEFWVWCDDHVDSEHWRPSIYMPRAFCRIELECLEDARRERLRDITEEEAVLEGCRPEPDWTAVMRYAQLWKTLHVKPSERWADNPNVIRVGPFRRIL